LLLENSCLVLYNSNVYFKIIDIHWLFSSDALLTIINQVCIKILE